MNPAGRRPEEALYIYYLEGRLSAEPAAAANGFVGNWEEDDFSFLFFRRPADQAVETLLTEQPHLRLIDRFCMTLTEWHGGRPAPLRVGRFLIVPPWEAETPAGNAIRIVLDPGVVFGTGTHPTTQDCLAALENVYRRSTPATVLDLGTGTGLLALAAARLGGRRLLAVDLNLLAARTARANVALNGLEARILVVRGAAENFIDFPNDLVISNMHYAVVQKILAEEGFFRSKWFILSGLLRSQAREITATLAQHPVEILKRWERDGIWHTFLGKMS